MNLTNFINKISIRGACMCGRCIDAPPNPEKHQPTGHTSDLIFFKVSLKGNPSDVDKESMKSEMIKLIKEHEGEFCEVDVFDGKEHNYLELGGWIGDQGLALTMMGVGELLGLWKLLTPKSMLGPFLTDELCNQMAGLGMITIRSQNKIFTG